MIARRRAARAPHADAVGRRLSPARLGARVSAAHARFIVLRAEQSAAATSRLEEASARLASAAASLDALSPLAVLRRGYSVAEDQSGVILRDARRVRVGEVGPLEARGGRAALPRGRSGEQLMSAPAQNNPPTQKRSRIVISLDRAREMMHLGGPQGQHPYYGGGPRPRRRKWPIITGAVLLFLVIGAVVFWQVYKRRPSYSLALVVDAAHRDDAAAFDRVVDTGQVVQSFAPQVVEQALGRLGTALTPEMRRRVEALVPTLLPTVTENVRGEVMREVKELTARAAGKPFFLLALSVPFIADVKREGDTAVVGIKHGERSLELVMQRTPESRWKVVGVRDEALAKRIVDNIARYLPAIGTDLGTEIEKRLPEILPNTKPRGRRR